MEDIRTGLKLAEVAFCPHTAGGALWELINIHGFPIAAVYLVTGVPVLL